MGRDEERSRPPNYLRAWREFRGLTQAQLAAIVGTQGSVISLLESGDRRLSDKWLRRLAPALGTTPSLLLDFHPDDTDQAMLELWGRIPETQKPALRTKLLDETVVELPIPRRKRDEDPTSERNENL